MHFVNCALHCTEVPGSKSKKKRKKSEKHVSQLSAIDHARVRVLAPIETFPYVFTST